MPEPEHLTHTFEPVYDKESALLILGTFPSVKSREMNFYYGHPQNRFWKVIAEITENPLPVTVPEKKELLLKEHIAVWDVIASCTISGSSDSSIRDVVPNDIAGVLKASKIGRIFANGAKAYELYQKYSYPNTGKPIIKLPSTSPANAACSFEKLCGIWRAELKIKVQD